MTYKIGIVAQDQPDGKFGINTNYIRFAYNFGRPIVILPESFDDYSQIYNIDALLLPGGADVDYKRYSKKPAYGSFGPNIYLEHFDTEILPKLVGKIPIFGICRGLQSLNVFFGGTLRNLWFHPYSNHEDDKVHKVMANGEKKELEVNSFHHQAIDKLGSYLTIEAQTDKINEGVIEAISCFSKGIFAVQWHPERLRNDEYSLNKFKLLIS